MEAPHPAPGWSSIVQKEVPPKSPTSIASRVFDGCKSKQGIAVAVIDANAIIQGGDQLVNMADRIFSVSEVLAEVRDPLSRIRFQAAPITVDVMEPDPDALRKVINFARETGDLQTLSDVDLKLIALAYTLEAQIHGTRHLRDKPPPLRLVNVKRLPEKEMPGWGSNVPNLKEWEALEHAGDAGSHFGSRILPLKDMNLNVMLTNGHTDSGSSSLENKNNIEDKQEDAESLPRRNRRYMPKKKVISIEGRQMVADGIDASLGEDKDCGSDWRPAVSRSTHRRYLRRQAKREMSEASRKHDRTNDGTQDGDESGSTSSLTWDASQCVGKDLDVADSNASVDVAETEGPILPEYCSNANSAVDDDGVEILATDLDNLEILSQADESVDISVVDDGNSEQSWAFRSLSDSSVACVTGDFAMQNVILQIGLRLVAPGGMQIQQLHRWILKCHACNKVTAEIGRLFCPKCGNGGTLRKVSATVGENGIILAARWPRVTLRGTKDFEMSHADDIFSHGPNERAPLRPPLRTAVTLFGGRRNPNDNHFSRGKR